MREPLPGSPTPPAHAVRSCNLPAHGEDAALAQFEPPPGPDPDPAESIEWRQSIDVVIRHDGTSWAQFMQQQMADFARRAVYLASGPASVTTGAAMRMDGVVGRSAI